MSSAWHGGKGSSSRPMSVSHEEYTNRWDHIFGRDQKKESPATTPATEPEESLITQRDRSEILNK